MFATLVFGCPHPTVHPSKDCFTIYFSMPSPSWLANFTRAVGKKYTSGPRYWNVSVLVNTGTFLVYQYCLKMWYLCSLEHAGIIQKLTILECENGLVLSNTRVPVSGTSSILFPAVVMQAFESGYEDTYWKCSSGSTPGIMHDVIWGKEVNPKKVKRRIRSLYDHCKRYSSGQHLVSHVWRVSFDMDSANYQCHIFIAQQRKCAPYNFTLKRHRKQLEIICWAREKKKKNKKMRTHN